MDSQPESEQERAEAVSRLYQQRMDEAIEHRNDEWELEKKHRKADERWARIRYVLGLIIVLAGAVSQYFSQVLPPLVLSLLGVLVVGATYLSQRDDARGKTVEAKSKKAALNAAIRRAENDKASGKVSMEEIVYRLALAVDEEDKQEAQTEGRN